jgi:sulfur carrier protein
MKITMNGNDESFDGTATVADLLERHALSPVRVAVEINEVLIPRTRFAGTTLRDRDRVEIVTLVGGG